VNVDHAESAQAEPRERPHIVRRIGTVALILGVLLGVAVAVAVAVVPALTGAHALTVLTGSMQPTLPVGSVVVAQPVPASQIASGDIITFTDRDPESEATRVVTHRVIDVQASSNGPTFGTKGDANNVADARRTAAGDVIGVRWYSVPWVGTVRDSLATPVGLSYAVGLLLLLVAGHLLLPKTSRRRTPARGPSN
jgi:signal peptidase I